MKRITAFLLSCFFIPLTLCACASGAGNEEKKDSPPKVVCTIFPEYDWAKNVVGGEEAELSVLLDQGTDLHSFAPSADDILTISTSDVFVYVGGESDAWVDDALKEAVNPDMQVVNLSEVLKDSLREEETVEGMQAEEDAEEEETAYDEHVWLSLRNASASVEAIADALGKADPDHAKAYKENAEAYQKKLKKLDQKYEKTVQKAPLKTLLFGDRFPFLYLTEDYGLDYYGAFAGCSAETEASFDTITFLAKKVDELSLPAVMTIEGSNGRIAETIIENTKEKDQKVLTLNSMQSVTAKEIGEGATYLSLMEQNREVLTEALKKE